MPLHNGFEDGSHGIIVKFINGQSIEMSQETSGDRITSSPWWENWVIN